MIGFIKITLLFFSMFLKKCDRIQQAPKEKKVFNVSDFGAVGDGKTDDYRAFITLADSVNAAGSATINLEKGKTYWIAPYSTKSQKVDDIVFKNCDGITFNGNNAVISVNGNFRRSVDRNTGKHLISNTNAVQPLVFRSCNNILVNDLEINGNVDKMTRDDSVIEGGGSLLVIENCDNISINKVFTHHAQTDGILIRGNRNSSRNLTMSDVTSSNNARQGLTIGVLYHGLIENSKFLSSGVTGGTYGGHAPRAGVDIEPAFKADGQKTGDIIFRKCVFANSRGGQFLVTGPQSTSNVLLQECTINAETSDNRYQMILAADSVVVDNCSIDCGNGNIWPTWASLPGSFVTIKNCTIKSGLSGIMSISQKGADKVVITNNTLTFTGDTLNSYFPFIRTKNAEFSGNEIYIPSSAIVSDKYTSLIQNVKIAKGNKFHSDKSGRKPKVSYQGAEKVDDAN